METADYHRSVEIFKNAFATGRKKELSFRKRQLRKLYKCVSKNEDVLCDNIRKYGLRQKPLYTCFAIVFP